jgi:putative sterol carrier protein
MVDDELKSQLKEKMESGDFGVEDLPQYMSLFADICNDNDDIKDEVDGWNRKLQFKVEGGDNDFWMKVEDQKFELGQGQLEDEPDVIMELSVNTIVGIFSGSVDATSAYMSGDLKVTGPLPDAVKFRTITEMVRDALD